MTRNDIEAVYRILLGRELSAADRNALTADYLRSVENLPLQDYVSRTMASDEFLALRKHVLLSLLVPQSTVVSTELPNGLEMYIDLRQVYVGWGILMGAYERDELAFVNAHLKPGFGFVDVGANVGYFSMVAAPLVGPTGFVTAFEPTSVSANLLRKSIDRNGLAQHVKLERAAVGAAPGRLVMTYDANTVNTGGAHVETQVYQAPHLVREEVDCVTLDSQRFPGRVHLIKVDVEGAELGVFKGASALLARDRPAMLVELNEQQLLEVSRCSSADLLQYLRTLGYRAHRIQAGGQLAPITGTADEIRALQGSKGNVNVVMLPR